MTAPKTAVVVSEERPAIAYPLRSPVMEVMRSEEARASIVPLLPRGADYEHVMIEVHRAATVNPDIMKCTPASIIMAVGLAVQTGLMIGKTIHLVPVRKKISKKGERDEYEDRLDAWTDYKGDIELVIRSGAARHVDAQVVYERDAFEFELGDTPFVKHRPVLSNRGRLIGAYAIAHLTATLKKIVVLSIDDIEKVRKNSKQWKPEYVRECPDWYAMKTAIHRVTKALPRNPALAAVLALLDRQAENDRADGAVDELGLDPLMQIAAPDPAMTPPVEAPATAAATAAEDARWETVATADAPEPARSTAWHFPMPFGKEGKGRPIGSFPPEDLESARAFARRRGGFQEFLDASDELLEERRQQEAGS